MTVSEPFEKILRYAQTLSFFDRDAIAETDGEPDRLEAGLHVLVAKPMTTRWEDAVALVAQARACGRTLSVAQQIRYNRHYLAVRDPQGMWEELVQKSVAPPRNLLRTRF